VTAARQGAHAREAVPLPVRLRRLRTALLLRVIGRAKAANRRHEPLPDTGHPHLCGIDWLPLGDPVHKRRPWRRRARQAGTDPAARAGWR